MKKLMFAIAVSVAFYSSAGAASFVPPKPDEIRRVVISVVQHGDISGDDQSGRGFSWRCKAYGELVTNCGKPSLAGSSAPSDSLTLTYSLANGRETLTIWETSMAIKYVVLWNLMGPVQNRLSDYISVLPEKDQVLFLERVNNIFKTGIPYRP